MGTQADADILALDDGHEWKDVVHELQRMKKWPDYTPEDEAAAVATLTKNAAEDAAKHKTT